MRRNNHRAVENEEEGNDLIQWSEENTVIIWFNEKAQSNMKRVK